MTYHDAPVVPSGAPPVVCTVHDGSAAGGAPGSSSADGPPTGRGAQGAQGGGSRRNALWRSWTSGDGLTETDGGGGRSGASFWTAADGVTAFKTINDAEVSDTAHDVTMAAVYHVSVTTSASRRQGLASEPL